METMSQKKQSLEDLDPSMKLKLFGNVTVGDMVNVKEEFGIKGYSFNPKLRFNFGNKKHMMPQQKKQTYLDQIMKEKAKIPSPDKYLCNVHKKDFNDISKKSKIYAYDRKSSFDDLIQISKKLPGTGKYDTTRFDEKRNRPPKGYHKVKA